MIRETLQCLSDTVVYLVIHQWKQNNYPMLVYITNDLSKQITRKEMKLNLLTCQESGHAGSVN